MNDLALAKQVIGMVKGAFQTKVSFSSNDILLTSPYLPSGKDCL